MTQRFPESGFGKSLKSLTNYHEICQLYCNTTHAGTGMYERRGGCWRNNYSTLAEKRRRFKTFSTFYSAKKLDERSKRIGLL